MASFCLVQTDTRAQYRLSGFVPGVGGVGFRYPHTLDQYSTRTCIPELRPAPHNSAAIHIAQYSPCQYRASRRTQVSTGHRVGQLKSVPGIA
eukprot:3002733-Rhodomonas_salina.1